MEGFDAEIKRLIEKTDFGERTEDDMKRDLFFGAIQAGNHAAAQRFLFEGVSPNATDEHGRSGLHMSALKSQQDIFKALLTKEADPELGDEAGITPLMCACQKGSEVIVDILLKKGVDVTKKNKDGLSAVFYALYNGHVNLAKKLEESKSSIHELQEEPIFSIYMKAVTKKWTEVVKFMSESSCDLSYHNKLLVASQAGLSGHADQLPYFKVKYDDKTKDGRSPINGAVQNGFYDAVKYMLENGCNVRDNNEVSRLAIQGGHLSVLKLLREYGAPLFPPDENGVTPIQLAVVVGRFEMFSYLVEENCSLESHKKMGSLALMAASKGNAKVLKYLADKKIVINEADPETGETPLLAASQSGPYEAVELLLDCGCDPNAKNKRGITPALRAAHNKQEEILMLLGDRGADLDVPNRRGETAILCAARNKSISMVRYLASKGCSLTAKDSNGMTVAQHAVKTNNVALLKYLQEKGVSLDESDSSGMTPLMAAVKKEAVEAIKQLTSTPNLCSLNHRDLNGKTAMHFAVSSDKMETVRILKDKGADLGVTDHEGNTPLLESFKHKKAYEMVRYLIQNGCDIQATNNKQRSAVHYACKQKKNDALLLLLDAGSPFDAPDLHGMTPFTTSAKENSESLTIVLKAMGADVNNRNEKGENAVHLVAKNGSLKLTLCLSLFGCTLDQEDNNGVTPLMIACEQKQADIVAFLLSKPDVNVNSISHSGETPTHFTCRSGSLEVLKLLVEKNAELDKPDLKGITPIMLAAAKQNKEFLNFLCSRKCDLKQVDRSQRTILHFAVEGKNEDAVSFLISNGLDPNALDESGTSPVLLSIKLNLPSIFMLLKNKGGIVAEIFDNESWSAAHFASKAGNLPLLKQLQGQMSFSSRTTSGDNCLTIACKYGQEEALKFLLKQKLNVNSKNAKGDSALHIAAKRSNLSLIPLLLDSGIRVSEKNDEGDNVLHILCQKKCTSKLDKVESLKNSNQEELEKLKKAADRAPEFMKEGFLKMIKKAESIPNTLLKKAVPKDTVSKSMLAKLVTRLLDMKIDPNETSNEGKSALHFACLDGSKQIFELLLSRGADVNLKDCNGETPIFNAIRTGKEKTVNLLLKNEARLDVVNRDGLTPLALAISLNQSQIIETLRDREAPFDRAATLQHLQLKSVFKIRSLNHLNFLMEIGFGGKMVVDGKTLVHYVVILGDVRILKALDDLKYNFIKEIVDKQDSNGDTALHIAIKRGRLDMANALVSIGCKVDIRNNDGQTILHDAAIKNQLALVEWAFEKCPQICKPESEDHKALSPLHLASMKGNLRVFEFLINKGFSAGHKSKDGKNCAHYAAIHGNLHILKYIRDLRSEPEADRILVAEDGSRLSPLNYAVLNGHENIATFLYECDSLLPDCLLHQVVANGNQHMATWLKNRKSTEVRVIESSMFLAFSSGNFHIIEMLLKNGGSLAARTQEHGNTLAQAAAAGNHQHLIRFLRENNEELDCIDNNGGTAILECSANGHIDSMRMLVELGCQLDRTDAKKRGIVHLACIGIDNKGHLNILKFAQEKQISLDEKDNQGNTGLIYASRQGYKDIVDFLLASGQCDPNRENSRKSTAAHMAALAGRADILEALSKHQARLDTEDDSGATPLMIAVHRESRDCVALLAEKAGLGSGSGKDRLMQLATGASLEVRQELERRGAEQLAAEGERPNQGIGSDIEISLDTYSALREKWQNDLQTIYHSNPFGYRMIQEEVTDYMRIEVASLVADRSTSHRSARQEDSGSDESEDDGEDSASPSQEEPDVCQQQ